MAAVVARAKTAMMANRAMVELELVRQNGFFSGWVKLVLLVAFSDFLIS